MKRKTIKIVTTNSKTGENRVTSSRNRKVVPVNSRVPTYPVRRNFDKPTNYRPIPVGSIKDPISFNATPGTPKIAFMFLTLESLHQGLAWYNFFKEGRDRCSIYCHPKYPEHIKQKFLQDAVINKVIPTKWAGVSLVRATNYMILEALKDPDNQYFMLLSEKCLPLYDFDYTYQKMTEQGKSWVFHYKWTLSPAQNQNRWKSLSEGNHRHLNPLNIRIDQFYKQSQWMLLNRKHAEIIAKNAPVANQFTKMSAPDEHFYINVLKDRIPLFHKENINHPITFVNWADSEVGNHPLEYKSVDVKTIQSLRANKYFKQAVNTRHNEPHLFMRKVPYDAKITW